MIVLLLFLNLRTGPQWEPQDAGCDRAIMHKPACQTRPLLIATLGLLLHAHAHLERHKIAVASRFFLGSDPNPHATARGDARWRQEKGKRMPGRPPNLPPMADRPQMVLFAMRDAVEAPP